MIELVRRREVERLIKAVRVGIVVGGMSLLQLHLVEAGSAPPVVGEVILHLRPIQPPLRRQEVEVAAEAAVDHVRVENGVELF